LLRLDKADASAVTVVSRVEEIMHDCARCARFRALGSMQ
jgi:hypothetical protein